MLTSVTTVRGNNASQSVHILAHHAFFCEGHPEAGAAAAVPATPAPVHLLLGFLRRAVTVGGFPKQTSALPLATLLHAGRQGQPKSHQLRGLGGRRQDVLHEHADNTGAAGGVRAAGGCVWCLGGDTSCAAAATAAASACGSRAGAAGSQ